MASAAYLEPLYDAVMVAFDKLSERHADITNARARVTEAIETALADADAYSVIVGRPNTAEAIRDRINRIYDIIVSVIE